MNASPPPVMRRLALLLAALPSSLVAQSPEDGHRCAQIAGHGPRHAEAVAHAERSITAEPKGAMAEFYRGCLAWAAPGGGTGKATEHFERAVKLNDGSAAAHDWLARTYGDRASDANPITQARLAPRIRAHFERAIALDPANVDARAYLVQFYLQAPRPLGGSREKAWAQIDALREIAPYRGALLAAQTRLQARDSASALQEFEALYAQHPDSIAVFNGVTVLNAAFGRFDRAFAAVDHALARDPDRRPALYVLGRLAALSGQRTDEGLAALERYLAGGATRPGEPSAAGAHFRIGGIHEKRGDPERARAAYRRALELDPANQEAKRALAALR